MADLSVFPRVSMYDCIGLPIEKRHFPNICRYFALLGKNRVFPMSDASKGLTIIRAIFAKFPGVFVFLSKLCSGIEQERFDGNRALERQVI